MSGPSSSTITTLSGVRSAVRRRSEPAGTPRTSNRPSAVGCAGQSGATTATSPKRAAAPARERMTKASSPSAPHCCPTTTVFRDPTSLCPVRTRAIDAANGDLEWPFRSAERDGGVPLVPGFLFLRRGERARRIAPGEVRTQVGIAPLNVVPPSFDESDDVADTARGSPAWRFVVHEFRGGFVDRPVAGLCRAQAVVDVVEVHAQALVESGELLEDLSAGGEACSRDRSALTRHRRHVE